MDINPLVSLPNEDRIIRILTLPHQYNEHKIKSIRNPNNIYYIRCSSMNGSCKFCGVGYYLSRGWLIGLIDRLLNEYKEYAFNANQFNMIRKLVREYRDPLGYDIIISNGNMIIGSREPLSDADNKLANFVQLDSLKKRVSPSLVSCTNNLYKRYKEDLGESICLDRLEM
jgi:hypothetical protein